MRDFLLFSVICFPENGCFTAAELKGGKKSVAKRVEAKIFQEKRTVFKIPLNCPFPP